LLGSRISKGGGPVKLSILIPSNRQGLLVVSRIAQACSWANADVEVIVRDNSGNAEKAELIARFERDNCRIIIAEPCDGLKNFTEILALARADFVFLLADDDLCFDHAVAALPAMLAQYAGDRGVIGVTGLYAVETTQGTAIVSYKDAEADDVAARVTGFLNYSGPNILHYAPMRRELVARVFTFMRSLPLYFSFHDQIICLLYLLNGRFARMQRLLYLYEMGAWEQAETAQKRDVDFYREAGLDPAINALHWLLCGFEGAALIMNSTMLPAYPPAVRQPIADRWFTSMFVRFRATPRLTFGSAHGAEADKLAAKLKTATGQLTFERVLAEICAFMATFARPEAERYFAFWQAMIARRQAPTQQRAAEPAHQDSP
jgi:hypothetical protein